MTTFKISSVGMAVLLSCVHNGAKGIAPFGMLEEYQGDWYTDHEGVSWLVAIVHDPHQTGEDRYFAKLDRKEGNKVTTGYFDCEKLRVFTVVLRVDLTEIGAQRSLEEPDGEKEDWFSSPPRPWMLTAPPVTEGESQPALIGGGEPEDEAAKKAEGAGAKPK